MLSRDDIRMLLEELADELDAIFEPKQVIYAAAERVGERHGLPSGWLNDGVKGFLPGPDADATVLFDRPGLAVRIASRAICSR